MFDFLPILQKYGIDHVERGKWVQRGNVGIRCPFCVNDPGYHMGISLTTGYWHCWKSDAHSGRKPHRLLVALLRCTWREAEEIVGTGATAVGIDILKQRAADLFNPAPVPVVKIERHEMPEDFRPNLWKEAGTRKEVLKYLKSRGFLQDHIPEVCRRYKLRSALCKPWAWRLIMPFLYHGGVVGWTGRHVRGGEPKYLSFPSNESVKHLLFNYDNAAGGGRTLAIVEGPVDCFKMDFYGAFQGHHAVGLLGTSATPAQIVLLLELAARYDDTIIVLDEDAGGQAMRLASQLAMARPRVRLLNIKDPGMIPPAGIPAIYTPAN